DISDFRTVCYYLRWDQRQDKISIFSPQDVDTSLCTHLIYAFVKLENITLGIYEENDEKIFEELIKLKETNRDLKVMLSIGGWNEINTDLSMMLSNHVSRKHFINQSVEYLRKWNLDGLDFHFYHPINECKQKLTYLIQGLRDAFTSESRTTGKPSMELSIAVPGNTEDIKNGFELDQLHKNLNFVSIIVYDYDGWSQNVTRHNSPLFSNNNSSSLSWSTSYVELSGVEPSKIVVGVPLYGRCFILEDSNNTKVGALVAGPCPSGEYSHIPGVVSYAEICLTYINNPETKFYWSDEHQASYLVYKNLWISYENERSLVRKVDYLYQKNYGGCMAWNLQFDDFNGNFCNTGLRFPLLKVLSGERDIKYVHLSHLFCF
ncbi:hypothetical protein HELRODRAFT_80604, partial [Helobdella robusta]|uniref:GH18 domain-containing protein n=1 Tax=Helobdella robusta TaxID=6412 RepID=T1G427_HELRO